MTTFFRKVISFTPVQVFFRLLRRFVSRLCEVLKNLFYNEKFIIWAIFVMSSVNIFLGQKNTTLNNKINVDTVESLRRRTDLAYFSSIKDMAQATNELGEVLPVEENIFPRRAYIVYSNMVITLGSSKKKLINLERINDYEDFRSNIEEDIFQRYGESITHIEARIAKTTESRDFYSRVLDVMQLAVVLFALISAFFQSTFHNKEKNGVLIESFPQN